MAKNIAKRSNRKYIEQRMLDEKKKKYDAANRRLRIFPLISLALAALTLVFMLVDWAAVNNSQSGIEVRVTGFNCVAAGLTGNYTSTASVFGDIAVPFNYYAASYLRPLAALSVAVMFVVIAHILVEIFASITNKQGAFHILSIVFCAVQFALFIACYAAALAMKDSEILSGYCNGNPACSIISQAILPALFSLFALASPIFGIVMSRRVKKLLN